MIINHRLDRIRGISNFKTHKPIPPSLNHPSAFSIIRTAFEAQLRARRSSGGGGGVAEGVPAWMAKGLSAAPFPSKLNTEISTFSGRASLIANISLITQSVRVPGVLLSR